MTRTVSFMMAASLLCATGTQAQTPTRTTAPTSDSAITGARRPAAALDGTLAFQRDGRVLLQRAGGVAESIGGGSDYQRDAAWTALERLQVELRAFVDALRPLAIG